MLPEESGEGLRVLAKQVSPRFNQEWHYHLAAAGGKPRCGAALNLHEWQVRVVPRPPAGLCERCARTLGPRGRARVAPRPDDTPPDENQLLLPLDD